LKHQEAKLMQQHELKYRFKHIATDTVMTINGTCGVLVAEFRRNPEYRELNAGALKPEWHEDFDGIFGNRKEIKKQAAAV
jgi:hypothetical protein